MSILLRRFLIGTKRIVLFEKFMNKDFESSV